MSYDSTDTRTTITLAMPAYVPRARGLSAKGKFGASFKVATTLEEKARVQDAADRLGISMAEFVRWLAVAASKEVLKDAPEPEPLST